MPNFARWLDRELKAEKSAIINDADRAALSLMERPHWWTDPEIFTKLEDPLLRAAAFYYLHIQPDNSFAGGGVYNPQPGPLNLIRTAIDADFESWKKVIGNSRFKRMFPSGIHSPSTLSKVPKGFEQSSPAADFLKMKGFYTMEQLSDKEIVSGEAFEKVTACFKAVKPLIDFINQAIYQPAKS